MLENIKAVIFDMDGTLIDSMWVWQAIDCEYMARYGFEYTEEFHKAIEGMNFYDTACYFKEHFNIDKSVDAIIEDWHNMAHDKYICDVKFKEGAVSFIEKLKKCGIKTGIATSNSRELVDAFLEENKADKYFNYVCTSSEVTASKPAPDLYLTVAKQLSVSPENCLVFEDIPNGIRAGINAGMKTCAVWDRFSVHCDEEKKGLADYYINDFNEIEF